MLERQVNSTIDKDPEDSALYEGLDTAEPFEAVRGKILESLRQRRTARAKALAFILTNPRFEVVRLKDLAREIGMKAKRFDQCLDTNEGGEAVKAHSEEAIKPGLPGTPGFFLNGRFFSGILTYDPLRQILEEELKRVSGESRAASLQ